MSIIIISPTLDIESASSSRIGNKACGLVRLQKLGFEVPSTVVLPAHTPLTEIVMDTVRKHLACDEQLIARSSSDLEDQRGMSMAGAFLSVKINRVEHLSKAVMQVRAHARKSFEQPEIAVLIQNVIQGPGGVYLSERNPSRESLEVSVLGPESVTSGLATADDLLGRSSVEYQACLRACRRVAQAINEPCDIEFVMLGDRIVFLQCRSNSGTMPVADLDPLREYFPRPLSKLCGSLWQRALSSAFKQPVEFNGGMLFLNKTANCKEMLAVSFEPRKPDYSGAIDYYRNVLFPRWRRTVDDIDSTSSLPPREAWRRSLTLWESFYREYFSNPHECDVQDARETVGLGGSLSPSIIAWLRDLRILHRRLEDAAERQDERTAILEEFKSKYWFRFSDSHYFDEVPLVEQPGRLESLAAMSETQLERAGESNVPTLQLQTAWLGFDDNEYKHYANMAVRRVIIRTAAVLNRMGLDVDERSIWKLDVGQIESLLNGESIALSGQSDEFIQDDPTNGVSTFEESYPANVLSDGYARGSIERDPLKVQVDSIFVSETIDSAFYPIMQRAAGSIVAYGGPNSHYAIFSRDIHKPLYCSLKAVNEIPTGKIVILVPQTMEIHVENSN